ncbi:MAG: cryptochrome/photolyase family protein, partial [Methylocystis sp.]
MTTLRVILGDQLSHDLSALSDLDQANDIILMMEVMEECSYVPHHKQKIVLILSAMRHFAAELKKSKITVDYVELNDSSNSGNFTDEVKRAIKRHKITRLIITEPGEWRVQKMIQSWSKDLKIAVEIRPDTRFFASHAYFNNWKKGRQIWRMEHFYHEMRRTHDILMDGEKVMQENYVDFDLYIDASGHAFATSPQGEVEAYIEIKQPSNIRLSWQLIERRQT